MIMDKMFWTVWSVFLVRSIIGRFEDDSDVKRGTGVDSETLVGPTEGRCGGYPCLGSPH